MPVGQNNAVLAQSADRTEFNRHERGAERCRADILHRHTTLHCDSADNIDVAGFALIDAHSGRCVAFDVFDRAKSFAHRQMHVVQGDVVLVIDERFRGRAVLIDMPKRLDPIVRFARHRANIDNRHGQSERCERFACHLRTVSHDIAEAKRAVGGAGA